MQIRWKPSRINQLGSQRSKMKSPGLISIVVSATISLNSMIVSKIVKKWLLLICWISKRRQNKAIAITTTTILVMAAMVHITMIMITTTMMKMKAIIESKEKQYNAATVDKMGTWYLSVGTSKMNTRVSATNTDTIKTTAGNWIQIWRNVVIIVVRTVITKINAYKNIQNWNVDTEDKIIKWIAMTMTIPITIATSIAVRTTTTRSRTLTSEYSLLVLTLKVNKISFTVMIISLMKDTAVNPNMTKLSKLQPTLRIKFWSRVVKKEHSNK